MKWPLMCLIILLALTSAATAQDLSNSDQQVPEPKVAFLKSMIVPGWGHYYVNPSDWNRGQYHLAAEAVVMLSYLGLSVHSNNLQQNWYTYGQDEAGVTIEGRSRRFQLAVGNFDNLEAYNDYQLRSRNWDQLFEDRPENRWNWGSDRERSRYNDMRSRFENIDQQLPALLAIMAVNRVISAISAYNRAKKKVRSNSVSSSVSLSPYRFSSGVIANVKVQF